METTLNACIHFHFISSHFSCLAATGAYGMAGFRAFCVIHMFWVCVCGIFVSEMSFYCHAIRMLHLLIFSWICQIGLNVIKVSLKLECVCIIAPSQVFVQFLHLTKSKINTWDRFADDHFRESFTFTINSIDRLPLALSLKLSLFHFIVDNSPLLRCNKVSKSKLLYGSALVFFFF